MPPRPLFPLYSRFRLLPLLGLLLFALLAGCVEFEGQTILVRLDKATDTIHVRLIYHGIYAAKDETDPSEGVDEALKQLKTVVDRGTRFYFFDNWPLEADVGPPAEGDEDKPGNALLRPFTKVRNGRFFLDREGKLCAWQDLEISKASEFLQQANRFISLAVLTGQVDALKEADGTTRRLVQEWMTKGEPWVVLDGKGAALRLPVSDADATRIKTAVLMDAVETVQRDVRRADEANAKGETPLPFERTLAGAQARMLAETRFSVIHEPGSLTVRIAPDARGIFRLDWRNAGAYVSNLLEPVKQGEVPPELPLPVERQLREAELIERFAAPPGTGEELDGKEKGR